MKQLFSLFLFLFLFSVTCQQSCQQLFNTAHATLIDKLETFVQDALSGSQQNINNLTAEISNFKSGFPQQVNSINQGHCVGFFSASSQTCCSRSFTQGLRNTVDSYIKKKSLIRPAVFKVMQWFKTRLDTNTCLNTTQKSKASDKVKAIDLQKIKKYTDQAIRRYLQDSEEEEKEFLEETVKAQFNDFYDNNNLKRNLQTNDFIQPKWSDFIGTKPSAFGYFFSLEVRSLACQAISLVATRRFYLGSTCIFCAPTNTLSSYFSSSNLKIKTDALEAYRKAMGRSLACQQDIAKEINNLVDVNSPDSPFYQITKTQCTTLFTEFKNRIVNAVYRPCGGLADQTENQCITYCAGQDGFLKTNGGCLAQTDLSEGTYTRILQNNNNKRILTSEYIADNSGINAKIVDPQAESQIKVGSVSTTGTVDLIDFLDSTFQKFSLLAAATIFFISLIV